MDRGGCETINSAVPLTTGRKGGPESLEGELAVQKSDGGGDLSIYRLGERARRRQEREARGPFLLFYDDGKDTYLTFLLEYHWYRVNQRTLARSIGQISVSFKLLPPTRSTSICPLDGTPQLSGRLYTRSHRICRHALATVQQSASESARWSSSLGRRQPSGVRARPCSLRLRRSRTARCPSGQRLAMRKQEGAARGGHGGGQAVMAGGGAGLGEPCVGKGWSCWIPGGE